MIRTIGIVFYIALLLTGSAACRKMSDKHCEVHTAAPDSEIAELQSYISRRGIQAEKDGRGFFYRIEAPGNSRQPSACSAVLVDYKGELTSGAPFDEGLDQTFDLSELIPGWREGLPLIGEGGRIILYLPPALGYGSAGTGPIPPNSITIFDIRLKAVYD